MNKVTEAYAVFDIKEAYVKFIDETKSSSATCVGKITHELETITTQQKCGQVVLNQRSNGSGNGTATIDMYIPVETYREMYGMNLSNLKEGVHGYGSPSLHKEFTYTGVVVDEKGLEKLIAYPRCVVSAGPNMEVEHGQTEINAPSIPITLLPDNNGLCFYDVFESELPEEIGRASCRESVSSPV